MKKIGFIGCGNMGKALANAAAKTDNEIYLSDYSEEKLESAVKELNAVKSNNGEIATLCDVIFLGVKPQVLSDALEPLKELFKSRPSRFVIVSMAAGIPIASLEEMTGGKYPIIRIMPNTPAAVGNGMILYCKNDLATDEDINVFLNAMQYAGLCDYIEESLFDAATAVSGCGPAFCYMFVEALAKGGVKAGLPESTALRLAAQTLIGSGAMVKETGIDPETLKINVCSPGGSTIEGVKSLDSDNLSEIVIKAVTASYNRTKELGKK